jgi:acetylglutamate kinase
MNGSRELRVPGNREDTMDLNGRTMVIRVDEATLGAEGATFFSDLVFLGNLGMRPVVVAPTKDAARAVVRTMNRSGDTAVGLTGADAGMIPAAGAESIGNVDPKLLRTLLDAGYVPVIEPLAFGFTGNDVAVAADDVAQALASAVGAARAIFFHYQGGVIDAKTRMLVDELTPAEALTIAEDATLENDLRTAVRAAALGVRGGVGAAQICDGRIAHAAIVEFLTSRHLGTQVAGTVYTG